VGKLFKTGSHRKLAREIIDSLQQDDKETKGTYAAKYALNNFSWNRIVQELITVYKSVLPGKEVQINENSHGSTDLLGNRF
jgi:glycosyltransferase involved in cell wall biosynthesis